MESVDLLKALHNNDILEISRLGRHQDFKMIVNVPHKENMLTPIWFMKKDDKYFEETILDVLIKNDAIIDFTNRDEQTLLMYCIERGYIKMSYALLKNDCDIDIQDKCGMTALHYAVYNLDVDMVKLLIKCGIDVNVEDNTGSTALDYVKNNIHHQHIDDIVQKKKKCIKLLSL
jgi:ankyrin repeat protein